MTDHDMHEHRILAATARSFMDSFADNDYLNRQEESEAGFEDDRWKHMCDLGWTSLIVPESAGGGGADAATASVIAAEAGRAAFASPLLTTLRASILATRLGDGANEPTARIAEGQPVTVLSPPDGGIVARENDDAFVLAGRPAIVEWLTPSASVVVLIPRADHPTWLCAALEDSQIRGERARAVESIDNERCAQFDVEGLVIGRGQVIASDLTEVEARSALAAADVIRIGAMVGGAEAVLALSTEYALERHQFGQPIGAFQAVRHHLARMAIAVDAARLSYREAVILGAHETQERLGAAIGVFVAGRSYVEAVLTAAQIHGGIGTTTSHVLHHHFRRAKALQLRAGRKDARLRELTRMLIHERLGGPW